MNCKTIWISDLHLGTRHCNAAGVLEFLKHHECERLYLVGDIVELWHLRRNRFWPQTHNDVIQKLLRKARKGVEVIWIPGNHADGVVCGHIHTAAVTRIRGIAYYNCGDWVESSTALVERHDGRIELVRWRRAPAPAVDRWVVGEIRTPRELIKAEPALVS